MESPEVRLARMEEKLDFLVQRIGGVCDRGRDHDKRIDALERDAVRTKTLFGVLGAFWTLFSGLLGAWLRGRF